MMPSFTCCVCRSVFVDELSINDVPPELLPTNYDARWNPFRRAIATPTWAVQGPQVTPRLAPRVARRTIDRRIPLPPVERPRLFVAPDGAIVTHPHPDVPSDSEILRRRAALQNRPPNPRTDGPECSICLDEHSGTVAQSGQCVHGFHRTCYERWLEQQNKCPLCNTIVAP